MLPDSKLTASKTTEHVVAQEGIPPGGRAGRKGGDYTEQVHQGVSLWNPNGESLKGKKKKEERD